MPNPGTSEDSGGSGGISLPWSDYASPRTWVLSIIVGAVFGFVSAVFDALILAGQEVGFAFGRAGEMFYFGGAQIASVVLSVVRAPFGVLESMAAGAGPFAPLVVGLVWFAAGALIVAFVGLIWRVVRWL